MFSGIKHSALMLHIGYTIESFLIHIETLSNAREKCIPIKISGLVPFMYFLVQNEQLEPVLIRNEIFTVSRNYAIE